MIKLIPYIETRSFDLDYRSEDIRFSPSGRRLARVATDGCVLLSAVDIDARPILVEAEVELRSPSLLIPHGIDFVSENVIVVANRNGNLVFYQIPHPSEWRDSCVIEPMYELLSPLFGQTDVTRKLRERDLFCGPGSVRLHNGVLFVACNYMNTVSTFSCQLGEDGLHIQEGTVVAHEGLSVIDGIAISLDGRLMALSDHDHHRIVIYRRTEYAKNADAEHKLRAHFKPACSLSEFDMHFPHGLRFDGEAKVLYAVDAGGRFIHLFESADDWQTDMQHSTVKTCGVDLDAFNKSKQSVPEAHRILEGGGKGLDIDPSGRVLVVTCRNQSFRFFEIETKENLQFIKKSNRRTQVIANISNIALSCLIDDIPSIWRSVVPWLATATRLANIPPACIHIHHVCDLTPAVARLCHELGVNTYPVARFDVRNAYANKIIQSETRFGDVDSVVLTDVDLVFAGEPPFHELQGFVAGKLVDMENPPLRILKSIFAKAGVGIIGVSSNEYGENDIFHIFETIIGNFNGGVYVIPCADLVQLGQRWGVWARWLLERVELMERWAKHLDQIAFCLAVNECKIPLRILNNLWNYPAHLATSPIKGEPWIFHHHAYLDDQFRMKPMADPIAQNAIERVNDAIMSFRGQWGL